MKSTYDNLEDIMVFDNIISPAYQDWLYNIVNSNSFLWNRQDITVIDEEKYLNDKRNGFANIHNLFEGELDLKTFNCKDVIHHNIKIINCFFPLLFEFIEPLNINFISRIRIKAYPAIGTNQIQLPHVDQVTPNTWNVIYYFNDTDGDTVIYNERAKSVDQMEYLLSKDVWTIKQRVSPKKGRAVAFKGDLMHSASYPKNKSRFILNINLSENPESEVSQNCLKYN